MNGKRILRGLRTGVALAALAGTPVACAKACGPSQLELNTPPAPSMPEGWTIARNDAIRKDTAEFLDTEGRLKGRLDALRIATYEVGTQRVQLFVMKPADQAEGDKIFRILANKKKPWAYLRKGELIYEFQGPREAEPEIEKAHAQLSKQP